MGMAAIKNFISGALLQAERHNDRMERARVPRDLRQNAATEARAHLLAAVASEGPPEPADIMRAAAGRNGGTRFARGDGGAVDEQGSSGRHPPSGIPMPCW